MSSNGGREPIGRTGREPAGVRGGRVVREVLTCMLIVAVATAVGGATGWGAALLALEMSEGDARGGEMLLLGFSLLGGGALGFVVGLVGALRHARRRGSTRGAP